MICTPADKAELKKLIGVLLETPYEEFDHWDARTLREWMLEHTSNEGLIALWEFIAVLEAITENWWDHSASDNLYVRKMHYSEKRIAANSFWPGQGWDGLFRDLRDAVVEQGGEVRLNTRASRVVIENGRSAGGLRRSETAGATELRPRARPSSCTRPFPCPSP